MNTFENIIRMFPKEYSVLDVGAAGLLGENTTQWLYERFRKNLLGININGKDVAKFKEVFPEANIIVDDFYAYGFDRQFDLVVLDLTIEKNLKDWSEEGIERAGKLVKKGGYLMNFVMMTDQYGNPNETPLLIKEHAKKWWGELTKEAVGKKLKMLKGFEFVLAESEDRRNYILWVVLKKR